MMFAPYKHLPVRPPLCGGLAVTRGPEMLQPAQNTPTAEAGPITTALARRIAIATSQYAMASNGTIFAPPCKPVIPPAIEIHPVVVDTTCQSGGHRRDLRILLNHKAPRLVYRYWPRLVLSNGYAFKVIRGSVEVFEQHFFPQSHHRDKPGLRRHRDGALYYGGGSPIPLGHTSARSLRREF